MRMVVQTFLFVIFLFSTAAYPKFDDYNKPPVIEGYDVIKYKGVCRTNGPLRKLEQLEDCNHVIGPIILLERATADPALQLSILSVRGCVQIVSTDLFNLNWLLQATFSACHDGNNIEKNRYLCLTQSEKDAMIENRFPKDNIDVKYNECPSCLIGEVNEKCRTIIGSIIYTKESQVNLTNVVKIIGRLVISNVEIPKDFMFNVTIKAGLDDGGDPALILYNTSIPNENDLLNMKIETDAPMAISIRNIPGYVFPRDKLFMLKKNLKAGDLDVDEEMDGDCYLPKSDAPKNMIGLLDCVSFFGDVNLLIEDNSPISNAITMHPVVSVRIQEKRADMTRVFSNLQKIDLQSRDALVELTFDENVCYKSDAVARMQSTLAHRHRHRIRYNTEGCFKYLGYVTGYDLKYDDGLSMQKVIGILYLEPLMKTYPRLYDKWYHDHNRFKNLTIIHKPSYMQDDVPAVLIEMCGTMIEVPDFVFTANISSERDDDILVKVIGPGYRMPFDKYDMLAGKYGKHRLDIERMNEGECFLKDPIQDMSELDGCMRIVGHLRIIGDIPGKTTTVIRDISGCIHIENTKLDNLDFIKFDVSYNVQACVLCPTDDGFAIKNNPNLCADHKDFGVPMDSVVNNKPGCGNDIDPEFRQERNYVFYGNFNVSAMDPFLTVELIGRIIVTSTNFKEFNLFPFLKRIVYMGTGPAILVEGNENLTRFVLPALKEIKVLKGEKAVVFRNNVKLNLNSTEREIFKKASGTAEMLDEKESKEDEGRSELLVGLGIGLGAGLGAVLLVAATVVAAVVGTKMARKRKTEKTGKKRSAKQEKINKEKNNEKEPLIMKKAPGNDNDMKNKAKSNASPAVKKS